VARRIQPIDVRSVRSGAAVAPSLGLERQVRQIRLRAERRAGELWAISRVRVNTTKPHQEPDPSLVVEIIPLWLVNLLSFLTVFLVVVDRDHRHPKRMLPTPSFTVLARPGLALVIVPTIGITVSFICGLDLAEKVGVALIVMAPGVRVAPAWSGAGAEVPEPDRLTDQGLEILQGYPRERFEDNKNEPRYIEQEQKPGHTTSNGHKDVRQQPLALLYELSRVVQNDRRGHDDQKGYYSENGVNCPSDYGGHLKPSS
jgi:hypothetical protein